MIAGAEGWNAYVMPGLDSTWGLRAHAGEGRGLARTDPPLEKLGGGAYGGGHLVMHKARWACFLVGCFSVRCTCF